MDGALDAACELPVLADGAAVAEGDGPEPPQPARHSAASRAAAAGSARECEVCFANLFSIQCKAPFHIHFFPKVWYNTCILARSARRGV